MEPKRITRFKFAPGGPIKVRCANQSGEEYELDVSVNILKLTDTGEQDHQGRAKLEIHLAVSYASYPQEEPPLDTPVGPQRQVPFTPDYPGPAKVVFRDQEGRECEVDVTPIVVRVDDMGTRDAMRRSQFGVHIASHYAYANVKAADAPGSAPRVHVSGG